MYFLNLSALLEDILIVIYEDILTVIYPSPSWLSSYLVAKQSRDAGFGGIAYGSEVMTPLQGKHQPTACQSHQLPGQVAKAWTHRKWQQREGREREEKKNEIGGVGSAVQAPTSFLDIDQRKNREKGGLIMDEERGDCIRERKREWECTVDLLGAKKQAIIWARFNFNKCSFAFRLGQSLWSFSFRRREGLIYASSHTFFSPEFYPHPLFLQSSVNHPYHPLTTKTAALIWDLRDGFRKALCWHAKVSIRIQRNKIKTTECVCTSVSFSHHQNVVPHYTGRIYGWHEWDHTS